MLKASEIQTIPAALLSPVAVIKTTLTKATYGTTGVIGLAVWGCGPSRKESQSYRSQLCCIQSGSRDLWLLCSASHLLFLQSRSQVQEMMPPTLEVGLTTSSNPIKIIPHGHGHRQSNLEIPSHTQACPLDEFRSYQVDTQCGPPHVLIIQGLLLNVIAISKCSKGC